MRQACEHLRAVLDWLKDSQNELVEVTEGIIPSSRTYRFRNAVDVDSLRRQGLFSSPVRPCKLVTGEPGLTCLVHHDVIVWPGVEPEEPPLCPDLAPVVEWILSTGNTVVRRDVYAWSLQDLVLNFRDAVDMAQLEQHVILPPSVSFWSSQDTHYELQEGLSCATHRQGIAWPLRQ